MTDKRDKTKEKSKDKSQKDDDKAKSSNSSRKNKRRRRKKRGRDRKRSEFDQRIIDIRRVTRVVAGGRRFSFSVAMVMGDRNGRVGVGLGKANDIGQAIQKSANRARKNMVNIELDDNQMIPYNLKAKYKASEVEMRPAPGRGVAAGSSVRDVVEMAGINDITTKLISRSKNKLNNARAALEALRPLMKNDK